MLLEAPQLQVKDAVGFSGVWRDVYIEEWTQPANAAQMRLRHHKRDAYLRELGDRKVITVSIVRDEAARRLGDDERAAVNDGVASLGTRVKATAVVLDVKGFKAVIIRSLIAAVMLVQGGKYPTKTFEDLPTTFAWLAEFLDGEGGGKPTPQDLATAYETLRTAASGAPLV